MTPDTPSLKPFIAKVATGATLDEDEAGAAFDIIMSGDATPAQIGGFLMALRVRGETVPEIAGAARVMRAKALKVAAPVDAIDCCGTGGDAAGTLNISTAVSFVLAGCGVPVAKHGNRALSSRSGAADVLAALGVNIDCAMPLVERAIAEAKVGFLMAPRHHSAMRHVGPARVELATRTIFNLLGPLSNPAGARRQLVGVFAPQWLRPVAETLAKLGTEAAWVVHGADGLDEISTTGPTHVAALDDGAVREFTVSPGDVGLETVSLAALKGGDAAHNAAAITELLAGRTGAYRDIVLMNAGAALIVAGRARDLAAGVAQAARCIDTGRAVAALTALVRISHGDVEDRA